jgi:LPXTG-site transpeptidase (sortase) family protein
MFQDQGPAKAGGLRGLLARRGAVPLLGAAAVLLVVVGIVAIALGSGNGEDGSRAGAQPTAIGEGGGLATTLPTPEATMDPDRETTVIDRNPEIPIPQEGDRLVIAKFGIDAPLSYKVVGPDGVMPNPNGPDDVAFYDFSGFEGLGGFPGQGGNVVFSGHVDSGRVACRNGTVPPPCQAVFWDISNMRVGDEVEVIVSGVSHRYRVTSNQALHAVNTDWSKVVASTREESITLITCGGDFNRTTGEYSHRQVVVGVKV